MSKYVTNFTGLVALNEGLSEKCKEIYTDLVDPSCGYELSDRGVFKILEDGKVRPNQLFALSLSYPVLDVNSKEAKTRINEALEILINNIYTKYVIFYVIYN